MFLFGDKCSSDIQQDLCGMALGLKKEQDTLIGDVDADLQGYLVRDVVWRNEHSADHSVFFENS